MKKKTFSQLMDEYNKQRKRELIVNGVLLVVTIVGVTILTIVIPKGTDEA
jgi:hypothetical protein